MTVYSDYGREDEDNDKLAIDTQPASVDTQPASVDSIAIPKFQELCRANNGKNRWTQTNCSLRIRKKNGKRFREERGKRSEKTNRVFKYFLE